MITILTHGWLAKIFIILLWGIGIALRFITNDDSREELLFSVIAFSNFILYLMIAMRLPLLTHSQMVILLPNFSVKLKRILLVLFGVSLLPTLLVLPDVSTWLAFISISIISTLVFVAMIYQPKYQVFIWLFIFTPLLMELFDITLDKNELFNVLAWLLPIISVYAFYLLNKLVHYRGNRKHVSKMVATVNVSLGKTLAVHDNVPFSDRTKLSQWWSNTHFDYYRKCIQKASDNSLKIPNRKLIEISCQGANSFGINTYLIWSLGVSLICLVGLIIDVKYHQFFIPMVTIIPAMIIGTGTISLYQIIHNKKSYLARLAILPRFEKSNVFAKEFLIYIVINQAILYCFIALLMAITALVFNHINLVTYINLVLILLVFGLVSISVMFFSWRTERDYSNQVVWLLIIAFICSVIFCTFMASGQMEGLYNSGLFQTVLIASVIITMFSTHKYLNKYSNK